MKNLKQLLIDGKSLEAKTLVLENREDLEESIDVMLGMIENAQTHKINVVSTPWIRDGIQKITHSFDNRGEWKTSVESAEFTDKLNNLDPQDYERAYGPVNIGQALHWNDEKKDLECKTEDLDESTETDEAQLDVRTATGYSLDSIGACYDLKRDYGIPDQVFRIVIMNERQRVREKSELALDKPSALEEA